MNHGMIMTARRLRISLLCRHLEKCRLGQHQRRSLASQNEHESPKRGDAQSTKTSAQTVRFELTEMGGCGAPSTPLETPDDQRSAEQSFVMACFASLK
jgi:hypothetical protein